MRMDERIVTAQQGENAPQPGPNAPRASQAHPNLRSAGTGRRRGAQPGNLNALKHGLDSTAMRQASRPTPLPLQEEAEMLQTLIRRLFDMADGAQSMDELIDALRALGVGSTRLAALLRAQKQLQGQAGDETLQAINEALSEVLGELRA
jgi:hypothetical protein